MHDYDSTYQEEVKLDCEEDVEEKTRNLIKVLKANYRVIIACAWTTNEESEEFQKKPWVHSCNNAFCTKN